MRAKTVGFAIADEDRKSLEELVEYFGGGNRSEFLRVAMKKMRRELFAQKFNAIQSEIKDEIQGRVFSEKEILAICKAAR